MSIQTGHSNSLSISRNSSEGSMSDSNFFDDCLVLLIVVVFLSVPEPEVFNTAYWLTLRSISSIDPVIPVTFSCKCKYRWD